MNFVPQSSRFQTTVSRILKRRVAIDPLTFTALVFLLEFGAVVAISVVTGVVYHLAAYEASGDISAYLAVGVFGAAVYAVANTARGDYRLGNFLGGRDQSRGILVNWHATFLCLLAIGFLAQMSAIFSRAWIALFYASGLLLMVPLRRLLDRSDALGQPESASSPQSGSSWSARSLALPTSCSATSPRSSASRSPAAAFCRCCPAALATAAPRRCVMISSLRSSRRATPVRTPSSCWRPGPRPKRSCTARKNSAALPAELHLGPDHMVQEFTNAELLRIGPISTLQLTSAPLGPIQLLMKRVLDIVGRHRRDCSAVAAVPRGGVPDQARQPGPGVLPAAALRLQPADFPDREVPHHDGHGGRRRTSGRQRATIVASRGLGGGCVAGTSTSCRSCSTSCRATCRWWARARTRFRTIRNTKSRSGLYARRHNVKPGITGWAQVHGFRGETDAFRMLKRVEYDLHYIENWSLWLDLQILMRTLMSPHSYRNAY